MNIIPELSKYKFTFAKFIEWYRSSYSFSPIRCLDVNLFVTTNFKHQLGVLLEFISLQHIYIIVSDDSFIIYKGNNISSRKILFTKEYPNETSIMMLYYTALIKTFELIEKPF